MTVAKTLTLFGGEGFPKMTYDIVQMSVYIPEHTILICKVANYNFSIGKFKQNIILHEPQLHSFPHKTFPPSPFL